ncbi:MAG: hypothetical protein IPK69_01655 [Phycisphaerales bacterium]|nr:MAG: hypothetical protein IPK69_01655 [Phycisphaerales bacterium]
MIVIVVATTLGMSWGGAKTAFASPDFQPRIPSESRLPQRAKESLATLRDASADRSLRLAAASQLLLDAREEGVASALANILTEQASTDSAGAVLLGTLAFSSNPPPELLTPLQQRLNSTGEAELPQLIAALASYRLRSVAESILQFAAPARSPAVRSATYAALERLSGRTDMPRDVQAWTEWLDRVKALNETRWLAELAAAQGARADALSNEAAQAKDRLITVLRSNYLDTPPEDRTPALVALLNDPEISVASLGIELAVRELADGTPLDPAVGVASLSLLESRSPSLRARAATLANQLVPEGGSDVLIRALSAESDPPAAAAMLALVARWPSADTVAPAIRWLAKPGEARPAAAAALWDLERAGRLTNAERDQILSIIRSIPLDQRGESMANLLASIGNDDDRASLVSLLDAPVPGLRVAVASILAREPMHVDAILDATRRHPSLYPIAARALVWHKPSVESYTLLRSINPPSPEVGRDARLLLAQGLNVPGLLSAAKMATTSRERIDLLSMLTAEPRLMSEGLIPGNARIIVEGGLMLASERLSTHEFDAALRALDRISPLARATDVDVMDDLQVRALVGAGRLDLAAMLPSTLNAWIEGLRLVAGTPLAADVASEILVRFGSELNQEQSIEVAAAQNQTVTPAD